MGAYRDLKGKTFDRLTVLYDTGKRTKKHGNVVWKCRCRCGNEKEYSARSLMIGDAKACGNCPNADYFVAVIVDEKRKGKTFTFYIDVEDYEEVRKHNWFLTRGYVATKINGKITRLHQLLLGCPNSNIDHEDRNPLNNRRSNLRLCNQRQNMANAGLSLSNTTGYKGVSFDKSRQKFTAKIKSCGKTINLGRFENADAAAIAYNEAAKKLFDKFARINSIGDASGFNTLKPPDTS